MAMAQTAFKIRPALNRRRTVAANEAKSAEIPLFQAFLRPPSAKVTDRHCIKDTTTIDPACGSGGFLVMALKHIRQQYEELEKRRPGLNVVGLFREYADKYIRGIDFNPDLSRVAKMNMVLNDDGHTGIFHFDSLTPLSLWPGKITAKIKKNKIDIIMTNPPFGKKCVIDEKNT